MVDARICVYKKFNLSKFNLHLFLQFFQISNKKERYFINLLMMKMKMIGMDDVRIKEKQF